MKSEKLLKIIFDQIISVENLLEAWKEFERGKGNRKDVQEFSFRLMDNIFSLHNDLLHHTYRHGGYQAFKINDPKPRDIHKATVRDRLLHHAIYRILYPVFDKTFISDSYSCRIGKGTHKAINRFSDYFYKVSKNNTKTCWVLKCDIRKFFANINHEILIAFLREYILDKDILWLLESVIRSFESKDNAGLSLDPRFRGDDKKGLPLGNLTSQLFVNIYMNKFDQFVKHKLKAKYYIRYCDDFVILLGDRRYLESLVVKISEFLCDKLKLELHPGKVFIKALATGIDFLGMVNFPDHRILRTATKRRMLRKIRQKKFLLREDFISEDKFNQTFQSYLGVLKHCQGHEIKEKIRA